MTEKEWTSAPDPQVLLEYIGEKVSERKIRLFAIACCRTMEWLLSSSQQNALYIAERYADREATDRELEIALTNMLGHRIQKEINPQSTEGHIMRGVHAALYSDLLKAHYCSTEQKICSSLLLPCHLYTTLSVFSAECLPSQYEVGHAA